jgi:hypothetical protein
MSYSIWQEHIGLLDDSIDRSAVGIEKELVRVVEETFARIPRPVYTESISMSGMDVGNVPVMDKAGHLGESEPRFVTKVVEETKFNTLGIFGIDGEIRAGTIPGGALGVRSSWPDQCRQECASGR